MPNQDKIEFKLLDHKLIGSDTIVFRLEDGATVKVQVGLSRAGVALNFRNPDGTQNYNIGIDNRIVITPAERKFTIDRDKMPMPTSAPPKKDGPYT